MTPASQINELLSRGITKCIDTENIKKKLDSGKTLRIKFGIDPTGAIVHIGHAVPILKLADFQKMGHQIVLIIGDSTAQVGDSTDRDSERPMLTRVETKKNAENYLNYFSKILDIDKVEVRYNSEWMDQTGFNMVGEIAKTYSVAEMLDRDSFMKRYKNGERISLQEFLYPLMQGWDSVKVEADIELGGNDQYFNLMAGRRIQDTFGQAKQDILMTELIEGTDGRKMSKSYKNFVGLDLGANDMFVRLMEVNDDLIIKYFLNCTRVSLEQIESYRDELNAGKHPKEIKLILAHAIVSMYHGIEGADRAQKYFEQVLTGGARPDDADIPTKSIEADSDTLPLVAVLRMAGFVNNSTEARNALSSNGVKVNEKVIIDTKHEINLGEKTLIQVGKKKFGYVTKK